MQPIAPAMDIVMGNDNGIGIIDRYVAGYLATLDPDIVTFDDDAGTDLTVLKSNITTLE